MKLVSIEPISLKRVPSGPFGKNNPDEGTWPEIIIAKVTTTVNDALAEDWHGEHKLEFITRLVMTDASEPVHAIEQRALRQLASQLRDVAAALEAGTTPIG